MEDNTPCQYVNEDALLDMMKRHGNAAARSSRMSALMNNPVPELVSPISFDGTLALSIHSPSQSPPPVSPSASTRADSPALSLESFSEPLPLTGPTAIGLPTKVQSSFSAATAAPELCLFSQIDKVVPPLSDTLKQEFEAVYQRIISRRGPPQAIHAEAWVSDVLRDFPVEFAVLLRQRHGTLCGVRIAMAVYWGKLLREEKNILGVVSRNIRAGSEVATAEHLLAFVRSAGFRDTITYKQQHDPNELMAKIRWKTQCIVCTKAIRKRAHNPAAARHASRLSTLRLMHIPFTLSCGCKAHYHAQCLCKTMKLGRLACGLCLNPAYPVCTAPETLASFAEYTHDALKEAGKRIASPTPTRGVCSLCTRKVGPNTKDGIIAFPCCAPTGQFMHISCALGMFASTGHVRCPAALTPETADNHTSVNFMYPFHPSPR